MRSQCTSGRMKISAPSVEMFYVLLQEMEDVTFQHSLFLLVEAMTQSIKAILHVSDELIEKIYIDFFNKLPEFMQNALSEDFRVA